MELGQLRTFSVVAKTLHFTRASRELNLTQPAVSHQIKALEQELGERLFLREKRNIRLTSQGRMVLDYAEKMLREVDVLREEIEKSREALRGTVEVLAITRSLGNPFPEVRKEFREIYPDIELSFKAILDSEAILEMIRTRKADLAFTTRTDDFGNLLAIPYGEFEMIPVVGNKHPLAQRKKVSIEEIEKEEWILFESESWLRRATDKIFDRHGIAPERIYVSNDGSIIRTMVLDGTGVSLLPAWGIVSGLNSGELVRVELEDFAGIIPIHLVVAPDHRSKLVNVLVDFLLGRKVEGIHLFQSGNSSN